MDLVIWGHEHECIIHPQKNPETGFHVIQPGSSIATSLVAGEAVPKHVCILSITGKELKSEPIRLKTVRPFVTRDISLAEDSVAKKLAKKENHRVELTRRLEGLVNELIEEAKTEWYDAQDEEDGDEDREPPLPLIRLRVDHSAPDGGSFDIENPQRFSNRFVGKVANANDVIQYQKKKAASSRRGLNGAELPDASKLAEFDQLDSVKVDMLVQEFLMAQTLSVLPQSGFGDAVTQFVDKDDKHAMELFVNDSLKSSVEYLQVMDWEDDDELQSQLEANRDRLDKDFQAGHRKRSRPVRLKPKPEEWNSDIDGEWGDQPGAIIRSDLEDEEDSDDVAPTGRGSAARRGRGGNTAAAKRTTAAAAQKAAPSKAPTKAPARGSRRAQVDEDSEDEEAFDPMVIDDDDDGGAANDQSQGIFVDDEPTPPTRGKGSRGGRGGSRGGKAATTKTPAKAPAKKAAPAKKSAPAKATPAMSQSSLKSWAGSGTGTGTSAGRAKTRQVVEDASDDDEDEDAFEPAAATRGKGRR